MGKIVIARATPTVDTAAYASGDLIGGKLTFDVPRFGIIYAVTLADQAAQSAAIDVVLWGSNPAATTFTDQAALDIADADLLNWLGTINILAADYDNFSDNRGATVPNIVLPYYVEETGQNGAFNLYGSLVSRGTPTYVAATDLEVRLHILSLDR